VTGSYNAVGRAVRKRDDNFLATLFVAVSESSLESRRLAEIGRYARVHVQPHQSKQSIAPYLASCRKVCGGLRDARILQIPRTCSTLCAVADAMDFFKSAVASAISKGPAFGYSFGDRVDIDESIWTLYNGTKRVWPGLSALHDLMC
jgi:hypothetical protein